MKICIKLCIVILLSASFIFGQETSREEQLKQLVEAEKKIRSLTDEYLLPDENDFTEAQKQGFEVFRILPRDLLEETSYRGGSYYSFTTKSHNYGDIPQIALQKDNLSVGFAGADYGFMADLGEISLSAVNKESQSVNFLLNYQPPNQIAKARIEQNKARGFEQDGILYQNRFPVVISHIFILRAITFGRADILVAFKIHRKDTDGSLIVFWKMLKEFEKPILERN